MNHVHHGKIGHLPKDLQEQVNQRLEAGEAGVAVLSWLNALPEVRAVLASRFASRPITPQNLTKWRQRAYQKWLWERDARASAAACVAPPQAGAPPLAGQLTDWASVHYLMAVRQIVAREAHGESPLKILRAFCRDLVALRRADHAAARLQLAQARAASVPSVPSVPSAGPH